MIGLWDFALAAYGLPEVKTRLLKLQDRFHVDVNQVLWCVWTARCGYRLTPEQVADVLNTTSQMAAHTTRPLRSIRLFLEGPRSGFDSKDLKTLRDKVLSLEIETEELVLRRLDVATRQIGGAAEAVGDRLQQSEHLFTLVASNVDTPLMIAHEGGPETPSGLFRAIAQTVEDLVP